MRGLTKNDLIQPSTTLKLSGRIENQAIAIDCVITSRISEVMLVLVLVLGGRRKRVHVYEIAGNC